MLSNTMTDLHPNLPLLLTLRPEVDNMVSQNIILMFDGQYVDFPVNITTVVMSNTNVYTHSAGLVHNASSSSVYISYHSF